MLKNKSKKKICVIGMGFVGSVSAIIFSNIIEKKNYKYEVIGIEKNSHLGRKKIEKLNAGFFITKTNDPEIDNYMKKTKKLKNFNVKSDYDHLKSSDYVIIAINLDLIGNEKKPKIDFSNLIKISEIIGSYIKNETTVVVETTVPPGTCDKIIMPIILKNFKRRGIKTLPNLIHSYERVTPGKNYIKSIKKSFRIYSSSTIKAEKKFKDLYKDVIDLKNFSLIKLDKFIDSESAKILENSYRAINIAFMQEWTQFSYENKLSINKILNVIKLRKTHNNIMRPGLGVGGYCLTKDPLFAYLSTKKFFKGKKNNFEISRSAIRINRKMPEFTFKIVERLLKNKKNPKVAVFGITYKEDIGDMRFSPSKILIEKMERRNCKVDVFDPLIEKLPANLKAQLNLKFDYKKYDLIIFVVKNSFINKIDFKKFNNKKKFHIIDTDKCLTESNLNIIKKKKLDLINLNG